MSKKSKYIETTISFDAKVICPTCYSSNEFSAYNLKYADKDMLYLVCKGCKHPYPLSDANEVLKPGKNEHE